MAAPSLPIIPVADGAAIVNSLAHEFLGANAPLVLDDLSNLVDCGKQFSALDQQTQRILNSKFATLVTEQIVVSHAYTGNGLDIVRSRSVTHDAVDGISQKIRFKLPDSISDASTYDPTPGSSSDPFVNHPIEAESFYFSKRFAERFEYSEPQRWFQGTFLGIDGFYETISAIAQAVRNAVQLHVTSVSMAAVRASIAINMNGVDLTNGGARAINLLAEFNAGRSVLLKAAQAPTDPEFLRYMVTRVATLRDYMGDFSSNWNDMGWSGFAPVDDIEMVALSSIVRGLDGYLLSDTYHDELLNMPTTHKVPCWKGPGAGVDLMSFRSVSTVKDTFQMPDGSKVTVDTSGVVAHLFARDRIGVHNLSVVETQQYDPQVMKTNHFIHVRGKIVADPYENGITFYVKDPA